jgi:simple sugar transport system permease protein
MERIQLTLAESKASNKVGIFVSNQSIVVPITAIFVAFVLGGILIFLQGVNPLVAYKAIFSEAWFDSDGLLRTFQKTTPLVLAGLAVTVGLRVGLFNIGAQGQLVSAALASALAGIYITNLPPILHVLVALFCGIVVGAIWAGIAGVLKAYRGVHEVISTIMLNSIAIGILDYLVSNPFKEPDQTLQRTEKIAETAILPNFGFIPLSFILAIIVCLFISWMLNKTTAGFRFNTVGKNKFAATYAGINMKLMVVSGMLLSGGLAGLGGAIETLGITYRFEPAFNTGLGFDGITIALLARANPLATIPAAILVGTLRAGGASLQFETGIEPEIVDVLLAITLLLVSAPILGKYLFKGKAQKSANVTSGWGS